MPSIPTIKVEAIELSPAKRIDRLEFIFERLTPIPKSWYIAKGIGNDGKNETSDLECVECKDWDKLIECWNVAMKWTDGLDVALSSMLASVISTRSLGDQLWLKIVGPASCGKTTLCEALSTSKKYIYAKSTIRGFHSGFGDGKEDNSLLKQIQNKTLIIKDGDTLMKSPNIGQILSEARDIYDRVSRTHYRTKAGKDYEGINLTFLLCGTASIRSIDSSELGERFLDCVIMDGIDDEFEDAVLWKVVNRAAREVEFESNGSAETRFSKEEKAVKEMTGGYVNYLRENASLLLGNVYASDKVKRRCAKLGKFVAFMRARPSREQNETAEREFAARLASLLMRYSMCTAAVLNKNEVDDEVMRRTTKIALDTARGITMQIMGWMSQWGEDGVQVASLAKVINISVSDTSKLLRFMAKIGSVVHFIARVKTKNGDVSRKPKWKMSPILENLYHAIVPKP